MASKTLTLSLHGLSRIDHGIAKKVEHDILLRLSPIVSDAGRKLKVVSTHTDSNFTELNVSFFKSNTKLIAGIGGSDVNISVHTSSRAPDSKGNKVFVLPTGTLV